MAQKPLFLFSEAVNAVAECSKHQENTDTDLFVCQNPSEGLRGGRSEFIDLINNIIR